MRFCLSLSLAAAGGCALGPASYYRAVRTYAAKRSPVRVAVGPDAGRIVQRARAVAFVAPEGCAAKAGDEPQTAQMMLDCAPLMAEFEGRAVQQGFRVVGWRTLRGVPDPISTARISGADLVVRVREKATRFDPRTGLTAPKMAYVARRVSAAGQQAPLALSAPAAVTTRCNPQFNRLRARHLAAVELSADIVDTATSAPVWRLSRTFVENEDVDGRFRAEHGTRVRARRAYPTAPGVALVVCGLAFLAPAFISDAADRNMGLSTAGVTMSVGAAIAMLVTPHTLDTWPSADATLCTVDNAHWLRPGRLSRQRKTWQMRTFAEELFQRLGEAGQIKERP